MVSTRQKLLRLPVLRISINNVLIGNVLSYNYLGVMFDNELGLGRYITAVHTHVQHKLFHLRKIRKFINEFAAFQIYKQTILPLLDYCGFLIMSGNKNDYEALQILQNDALRACIGYPNGYELSRIALHEKAKLSSLYQRWDKQLLMMMHTVSTEEENILIPERQTRQATKIVFKQQKLVSKRYMKSPYIRGINLWGKLTGDTQRLDNKFEYKQAISCSYSVYDAHYLNVDIPVNPNVVNGN